MNYVFINAKILSPSCLAVCDHLAPSIAIVLSLLSRLSRGGRGAGGEGTEKIAHTAASLYAAVLEEGAHRGSKR